MAQPMIRLRAERGTCKTSLTKIENFLDRRDPEHISEEDLKSRLASISRAMAKFDSVQQNIYEILSYDEKAESAIVAETAEATDFEERVVNLEARIHCHLKRFTPAPGQHQVPSGEGDNIATLATSIAQAIRDANQSGRPDRIKLPNLQLPKFSGKYVDWQSFSDIFKCTIHENATLTGVQKFRHLKTLLEGDAEAVIKHIPVTEANYEDAWKLLDKRFDKKQCILFAHIDAFYGLKGVSDVSPSALRNLLNTTLESINAVDALGHKERDVWLINFILRKVDKETHSLWTREYAQTEIPSWDDFQDFLERRCDSLEASRSHADTVAASQKQDVNPKGPKTTKTSRTSLAVSVQECSMCRQGAHQSYQCPKFAAATPVQRLQLAKASKLCFNCLQSSHAYDTCQSSNCRRCQLKHNTMLHEALSSQSGGSQSTTAASVQAAVTPVTDPDPTSGGTQLNSCVSSGHRAASKQILLPTAIIMVRGGDGRMYKARALIDSCSQSNFVTSAFAHKSKLPTFSGNFQGISGIGQNTTTISGDTRFTFSSQDGQFVMTEDFMILENIVDDQPRASFEIPWTIPPGIQLADYEFNVRARVDVLLGAEVFIQTLRPQRIVGNPILQKTAFGFIVAGSVQTQTPQPPATLITSCVSTCLCLVNSEDTFHQQTEKFLQVEEPPITGVKLSKEEQQCDEHFEQNAVRDVEGRNSVQLPLPDNVETLGGSEVMARKRNHLKDSEMWFTGPNIEDIPQNESTVPDVISEELEQKVLCAVATQNDVWQVIERVSSYLKLIKYLSIWPRYFDNLRRHMQKKSLNSGPLTVQELRATNIQVIRAVQSECLVHDVNRISAGKKLTDSSRIKDLNSHIDDQSVLRAGERNWNYPQSSSHKHPSLLPEKHPFTRLIADKVHLETCHGGRQLMHYTVRQQYWPLGGLDVMKASRRRCVRCFRDQPKPMHQMMGNLVASHLHFIRAFDRVGVDLGEYFIIKAPLRRIAPMKMCINVFVWMVTHAVHLELTTDLSWDALLTTFRRFITRRKRPPDLFCDNVQHLVGIITKVSRSSKEIQNQGVLPGEYGDAAPCRLSLNFTTLF